MFLQHVDTDFAGCLVTRRSTTGGAAMRGGHLLKQWSLTQTSVALSSAEAELCGICKGTSTSLGLQAVAKDLGFTWSLRIRTDASAAIGVCRRRGLGKIRHLATSDLWIQERLRTGDFVLEKVDGHNNVADVLTKHVDRATLERHMLSLGLKEEYGRAQSAPTVDHLAAMMAPVRTISRMATLRW